MANTTPPPNKDMIQRALNDTRAELAQVTGHPHYEAMYKERFETTIYALEQALKGIK